MKRSTSLSRLDVFQGACKLRTLVSALAVVLLLTLVSAGCTSRSTAGGSQVIVRMPDGPAMNLASGLYQRGESLSSIAARGGANYTSGSRRHYFKFEVVAVKPGRILFTAFDPAGRPAFRLASDGQQMTGVMYGSNQYVSGPATAENFSRFIPLGLDPDQLIALMTGAQVRPAAAGAREVNGVTELVVVPFGGNDDERQLWRIRVDGSLAQDPHAAVVQSASFGPVRNPEVAIRYGSVRNVTREDQSGRMEPFPYSVDVQWTDGRKQSLQVSYDEVRLGLPVDAGLFTLPRPGNFELVNLN